MTTVEQILKQREEAQEIKCPHCGTIQPNDDYQYPVTYFGDDVAFEMACVECEKKFWVDEYVERTYTVGKTIDRNGYIIEES
jgi:C4-type Zn-finger protein